MEASSKEAAALLLQKYNIVVTSIKEQSSLISGGANIRLFNKVTKKDLAIFSRQLSVMLQARVPVTQSLRGLSLQVKNQSFKDKILKISQLVEEGNPLSEAFASFPEVFNVFYVSLIKTGEASGKISESLFYLSDHLEREHDIQSQITGAMIYPAFVILVLLTMIPMVIFFVMPRLVDLLSQATSAPPPFTQMMINFYAFLESKGLFLLAGLATIILASIYFFRTKKGKNFYDTWSLRLPLLGELFKKTFLVRFAENISTLI